jgi:zinc protease
LSLKSDGRGHDYVGRRNALVSAVTLDDLKRVARLFDPENLIISVVGKPSLHPESGVEESPAASAA